VTTGAPIPPGHGNGTGPVNTGPTTGAEGCVQVTAPDGLPVSSSFDITLWVNDGTAAQTETVPVDIRTTGRHD